MNTSKSVGRGKKKSVGEDYSLSVERGIGFQPVNRAWDRLPACQSARAIRFQPADCTCNSLPACHAELTPCKSLPL